MREAGRLAIYRAMAADPCARRAWREGLPSTRITREVRAPNPSFVRNQEMLSSFKSFRSSV